MNRMLFFPRGCLDRERERGREREQSREQRGDVFFPTPIKFKSKPCTPGSTVEDVF